MGGSHRSWIADCAYFLGDVQSGADIHTRARIAWHCIVLFIHYILLVIPPVSLFFFFFSLVVVAAAVDWRKQRRIVYIICCHDTSHWSA
jgi:hypothetical protein